MTFDDLLSLVASWQLYGYAVLGAFALWLRLRYGASFILDVERFINELVDNLRARVLCQMVLFVTFGALISIVMVEPISRKQALAAGMAWTAMLGGLATASRTGTGTKRGPRSGGGQGPR